MIRYEIAARHRSGHKLLIGYTPHISRPGLLAAVQQHSREIILALGTNKGDGTTIETQPPHCCRIGDGASSSLAAQRRGQNGKASYRSLLGITRATHRARRLERHFARGDDRRRGCLRTIPVPSR